jgi:peptide/nickel transport system ATP-binding protein
MRLLPKNGFHPEGSIRFGGTDLLELGERRMRRMRGEEMAMIFQEPMTSLNPLMRIGRQIREPLMLHRGMAPADADAQVVELLAKVGIPSPETRLSDFPHQMSGGMRQRVMIAMALACRPRLLIADEPTTALDVTIQAQILGLIKDLQQETEMAVLFITHDLGVVNQIADEVCVMYAGRFMEKGTRSQVFGEMAHPYTRGLFASLPSLRTRGGRLSTIPGTVPSLDKLPSGCRFRDRCRESFDLCAQKQPGESRIGDGHRGECHLLSPDVSRTRDEDAWEQDAGPGPKRPAGGMEGAFLEVADLRTHFPIKRGVFMRTVGSVRAVDGVSFRIPAGATLALVGESGCGKTTVGLSVLRLLREASGRVVFAAEDAMSWDKGRLRAMRSKLQIVFQDPFSSLSPRMTVGRIVGEGLRIHAPQLGRDEQLGRIREALGEVGLGPEVAGRYPHEFSGGQRQRISIARALVLQPEFVVLDEPTSALDVSVQAQILNLLRDLQSRHQLTYLFITHDLAVVRHMADLVAVMYLGRIVEYGPCERVFETPLHPYTHSLLQAIPSPEERRRLVRLEGEVPTPIAPPPGCHFHPRCPLYAAAAGQGQPLAKRCENDYPALLETAARHSVSCHAKHAEDGIGRDGLSQPTSPVSSPADVW